MATSADQEHGPAFIYLKITGWGWYYLATVLDDFSRDIVTWQARSHDVCLRRHGYVDQALTANVK